MRKQLMIRNNFNFWWMEVHVYLEKFITVHISLNPIRMLRCTVHIFGFNLSTWNLMQCLYIYWCLTWLSFQCSHVWNSILWNATSLFCYFYTGIYWRSSFSLLQDAYPEDDRQYEEIHPRESFHYESTPFIGQIQKPVVANRIPEQNNNPANPHGENYFILEPTAPPYGPPHGHQAQGRPPSIPPDHLIPLRQKYIISNQNQKPPELPLTNPETCNRASPVCRNSNGSYSETCNRASPICRNSNGNHTIGHIQRHSPHAFYPVCNHPGQFSLDRRSNNVKCGVDRTASVSSQTDSGLEYQFESDEEGYDKIEEFRKLARIPSNHSKPHEYDKVFLDNTDDVANKRQGEFSTFKRQDHSSC